MRDLRVYLAAPYACRDSLRPLVDELASIDVECTAAWINDDVEIGSGTVDAATDLDGSAVTQHALDDLAAVGRSDILVAFTPPTWRLGGPLTLIGSDGKSGGRHVETGYALANNIPVLVVGEPENIFHRGACANVSTWSEAVLWLIAAASRARPTEGGVNDEQ